MTTTTKKSAAEIAQTTAITKHQRAAEAHMAAAQSLRELPHGEGQDETIGESIQAHVAQAAKHIAKAEGLAGTTATPRTPQQVADDAEDRAGAASRAATIADRALRDALNDAANPGGAPQTGGTITAGDNPPPAQETAKPKVK